ncbi:hypothetical protein F4777DRAFT_578413 [Nemania sp. FL0916]|nr:hypothetical protein F4777DRAFT_578413 [Nemania sp. FL0916]
MSGNQTGPSVSPQTSPRTPGESNLYQSNLRGGGDHQREDRVPESTINDDTGAQSLPLRSIGVHTILNPAETQQLTRRRREETTSSPKAPSAASNPSPRGPPPSFGFLGQGVGRHEHTKPIVDDQISMAPPSMEGGSPGTTRSHPSLTVAQRVLTSRPPRLNSPGQVHPFRALNPPHSLPQHHSAGPQELSRIIPPESGVSGRPEQFVSARGSPLAPQLGRVMSPAGRPPLNKTSLTPSTLPISQPPPSHLHSSLQGRFLPGSPVVPTGQSPGYPPHSPYTTAIVSPSHSRYPGSGGDHRWPGGNEQVMQYESPGVRGFAFGEGQAALRIQPAHGEAFIVPVDTHQGSRQADEKRQRNAGASQRFRKRKKDRETQERLEHQRMESQYREMEARIQTLENDRERLRSDRDRLRDIVYRTPSLSDLAYQGPPSPDRSSESGPSPLSSRTRYGTADPETGERSSQRRRTDPQVEFMTSPYGSAPESLPPIAPSAYPGSISHPGTPAGRSQPPQLPPLRLGSAGGTPTTAVSATNTPVQAYQQVKREPYEGGWMGGSRPSNDPSQR